MSAGNNRRISQAREVAEIVIRNSAHNSTQSLTRYQSANTMANINLNDSLLNNSDYLHETLAAGSARDGRMSAVRRFFCLFVTFDLLFTTLLWILCFVLIGEDIMTQLIKQVAHYTYETSLFDIVMSAGCRFILILLFYGILGINHWCVIAVSIPIESTHSSLK